MAAYYLRSGSELMNDTSHYLTVLDYIRKSEVDEIVERAINRQTKQFRRSKWKSAIRRSRRKH